MIFRRVFNLSCCLVSPAYNVFVFAVRGFNCLKSCIVPGIRSSGSSSSLFWWVAREMPQSSIPQGRTASNVTQYSTIVHIYSLNIPCHAPLPLESSPVLEVCLTACTACGQAGPYCQVENARHFILTSYRLADMNMHCLTLSNCFQRVTEHLDRGQLIYSASA